MKEKILTYISILLPALLVSLAVWSWMTKEQHFPWLGAMIRKAEHQQEDLKQKIRQQEELIKTKMPAAGQLAAIREKSFSAKDDVSGQLRGRVERVFNASGARVRTIGSARQLKGSADIELYEIALTAEGNTNELLIILQELSKPPCLLWRSVAIRPNNMLTPEFLNMNITIAGVGFKDTPSASEGANE